MICGIYKILNVKNSKAYVGSSVNIEDRWQTHKWALRKGQHHSHHLQSSWSIHPEGDFEFSVIEECGKEELIEREQFYIDSLNPVYNMCKTAGRLNPPPNKPIDRIDIVTGECVEFRTRDEAASSGDFNESAVTSCCNGNAESYKGYYWVFSDGSTPDFINCKKELAVVRTDLDGSNPLVFKSMTEAARKTPGAEQPSISATCRGAIMSHAGYCWDFYEDSNIKLELNRARLSGQDGYGVYAVPEKRESNVYRNSVDLSERESTMGIPTPVDRISFGTGEITRYNSIASVSADGFNPSHVAGCCRGERNSHGGYAWKFADITLTEKQILEVKNKKPREINREIKRIDVKTKEIKLYRNTLAVADDGFSLGNVIACCNGKRNEHKGFFWEYVDSPIEHKVKRSSQPVIGTNLETGEERTYLNTKDLEADGFKPGKVSRCCMGRRKSHGGFSWRRG